MQTTPEMYQLSPLELTLAIRAAEAQNSLEYMYLVCKSGTVSKENQLDAMHLTSLLKNNPELLETAKTVLEVRRETEFQKFVGKTVEPTAEKSVDRQEVKKEYKSSLLVALKYAVDMAVYRCKAAIMAVNNAALKKSLSALEKVQVQVSQLEQLKDKELNLLQQISGNVPKQPKPSDEDLLIQKVAASESKPSDEDLLSPKVAASESKPSDEDLLSPKVSTATESVPAKKESADSAKQIKKESVDRLRLARNPDISPEALAELAKAEEFVIRFEVAQNKNTSAKTLAALAKDESLGVRLAVAGNPHTPAETLAELAIEEFSSIRLAVAGNPHTPAETLAELAKAEDSQIRYWVAKNKNTPVEVLQRLADNVYEELRVREAAAATKSTMDLLSPKLTAAETRGKKESADSVKVKI